MRSPHPRASNATPRALPLALLAALLLATLTAFVAPAQAAAPHRSHAVQPSARASRTASDVDPAAVLALVNRARSHARSCGGVSYRAVGPLRASTKLGRAARLFAHQMGRLDFFDHVAPDGSDPASRISATGYRWHAYGENIAAGYSTAKSVVAGWLASAGHCANIMTAFEDVGVGYADVATSTYGTYWVMDFGTH